MAEWSKAHDWKSCIPPKGIQGSNPCLSAIYNETPPCVGFWCKYARKLGFEPWRKWFENKVQADGSMPVSEAKNRCFDEVNLTLSANKTTTPKVVLFFYCS